MHQRDMSNSNRAAELTKYRPIIAHDILINHMNDF
jgi:hypothetical protein